jgi:phospholipase/lecithinase/hemolysin
MPNAPNPSATMSIMPVEKTFRISAHIIRARMADHGWIRTAVSLVEQALPVLTLANHSGTLGMGAAMIGSPNSALAFERIVVFGDSLSDNGNAGRFSNGPNWVEHLADRLRVSLKPSQSGGTNLAVGGAHLDPRSGPSSVRAQADRYLRDANSAGRTLYIVYGGGNDLLGSIGSPEGAAAVERATASLRSIVSDLARHGATDILVPNLPDVGITPAVRARGARALAQARDLTAGFNTALDQVLAPYAGCPTLRGHRLDVHAIGERVRADPASFGFSNVTQGCSALSTCDGHLFWDDVHPTTHAHARLAEAAFSIVSQ